MFQKVRLRLTILSAGITISIMLIMSLLYLHLSENILYESRYTSFQNDMNTITANLEQQSVISMEWLSKMEAQGSYIFFVLDNSVPFLYNKLSSPDRGALLEECLDACETRFPDFLSDQNVSAYLAQHVEYEFHSPSTNRDYFSSVIQLNRNNAGMQVVIISSLDTLENQISAQRIRFLFIGGFSFLLLLTFSWLFTGILLHPIQKNREQQIHFISSASHELRTPLAVILSCTECCANASGEKLNFFLKTIRQEGKRMSTLINDMLLLSQSDAHNFPLAKKPTELDTLLLNSYETFEPLAKEHGLHLYVHIPEEAMPPCMCDSERIRQLLSVFVHNAISYTPSGGSIFLSAGLRKDGFSLSVADTGVGISYEDKEKIFDRFYRAEKARSTKDHFGLGLSIAYEIVKAHHGIISVANREGGGTIFTAQLPR